MLKPIIFPEPVFHLWDTSVSLFSKEQFFQICKLLNAIQFSPKIEIYTEDPLHFDVKIRLCNPISKWEDLFSHLKNTRVCWLNRDFPLLKHAKIVDTCADLILPRMWDVKLFSSRHIPVGSDERFVQFYLDFVKLSPTIAYVYKFGQGVYLKERIFPSLTPYISSSSATNYVKESDPFKLVLLIREQIDSLFHSMAWNWDGSDMLEFAFWIRQIWDAQLQLENIMMTYLRDVRVRKLKRKPPLGSKKLSGLLSRLDKIRITLSTKPREQILADIFRAYNEPVESND